MHCTLGHNALTRLISRNHLNIVAISLGHNTQSLTRQRAAFAAVEFPLPCPARYTGLHMEARCSCRPYFEFAFLVFLDIRILFFDFVDIRY